MEEKQQFVKVADNCANPSPLGLIGFGMTTILLNIHNAGFTPLSVVILAMGLTIGGVSQVIAGIMEFSKNNTFGATAFTSYGFFWISLVFIWWNPFGVAGADAVSMGFYLLLWGIYTFFMFIGTLRINRDLQIVFGSLTLLFLLLAIGNFTGIAMVTKIAGYVGIICGICAIYASMHQVLAELYAEK